MLRRIILAGAAAILFAAFVPTAGTAQIAGGMDETTRTELGGKNFIVGMVFDPSGFPIATRMRIRISSMNAGREIISNTDDHGKFVFSGLAPGMYTVYIDDDGTGDYEAAAQTVDVTNPRSSAAQSYNISFRLAFKARSMKAKVVRADLADLPKKAVEHYQKALTIAAAGDQRGAINELQLAIAIDPTFTVAITELGIQQLKLGLLEDADKSFAGALKVKPDYYEALVNRGIGLFRQQKYVDAESALRSSINAKPDSLVGHFYLGRTLMAVNKLEDAEKELSIVLGDGQPQIIEVRRILLQLYIQRKEYAKALEQMDAYLAANPKAPDDEKLRKVQKQLQDAVASVKVPPKP